MAKSSPLYINVLIVWYHQHSLIVKWSHILLKSSASNNRRCLPFVLVGWVWLCLQPWHECGDGDSPLSKPPPAHQCPDVAPPWGIPQKKSTQATASSELWLDEHILENMQFCSISYFQCSILIQTRMLLQHKRPLNRFFFESALFSSPASVAEEGLFVPTTCHRG